MSLAIAVLLLGLPASAATAATDIAFVQANATVPQTAETVVSVPFGDPQTAGNLNVVVVGWADSDAAVVSVVDTMGNRYVRAVGPTVQPGTATQSIYYAIGIAAAAPGANVLTVTFTAPAQYVDIRIAEYSNVDRASPLDGVAASYGVGDVSASGSLTATCSNDLIVAANIVQTHTAAPGAGFTGRIFTEPNGDILEDRIVSAPGQSAAAAFIAGDSWWIMQAVAFRKSGCVPIISSLTYPPNNATAADLLTRSIEWTPVYGAQAYYLYVGSTPGGLDLVNTGEIQQLSYRASSLPSLTPLYARLWTKVGGTWRYNDSTFTVAPIVATMTYPANGATNADVATLPLKWSTVYGADAYSVYVGYSPGAKDLVNSGELQATSYMPPALLPAGQVLYARLWTKAAGVWRYTDSSFTAAAVTSVLTYPPNGATDADLSQKLRWTALVAADAYSLYLGTSPGATDVLNTGELPQTWYRVFTIPSGRTVYARVWARVGGVWRYTDSSFTAAPMTYTISGSIVPREIGRGATLVLSGGTSRVTTADDAGRYAFTGLAPGTYRVTASVLGLVSPAWSGAISSADVMNVDFTSIAPTRDRANSYDNDWKRAWALHARSVLATTTPKTPGFVLQLGDSITHARAYALWPLQGRGKTPDEGDVAAWVHADAWSAGTANVTSKNGWYLASADTSSRRGLTAAGGLKPSTFLSGCCNGGPDMPVIADPQAASQVLADPTYVANLEIDTAIAAFGDAQFAVVMLGTNDPGDVHALANLAAIVDKLEARHIVPVLSTIPPRADPYLNLLVVDYNAMVTGLAQARSLPLIGFHEELTLRRPGNSSANTLMSSDGVHPTSINGSYSADADPYLPGGDPTTHTTGDALLNVGYLLRSWLTIQKLLELKQYVIDGIDPP